MRHSILTILLPMFAYVTDASSGVMLGICFATLAHLVAEVAR